MLDLVNKCSDRSAGRSILVVLGSPDRLSRWVAKTKKVRPRKPKNAQGVIGVTVSTNAQFC